MQVLVHALCAENARRDFCKRMSDYIIPIGQQALFGETWVLRMGRKIFNILCNNYSSKQSKSMGWICVFLRMCTSKLFDNKCFICALCKFSKARTSLAIVFPSFSLDSDTWGGIKFYSVSYVSSYSKFIFRHTVCPISLIFNILCKLKFRPLK